GPALTGGLSPSGDQCQLCRSRRAGRSGTRTALANEIPPQQGVQLESATTRIERDQRLLAQAAYTRQMIETHPAIWRAVTLTLQRQVACQRAILTLQSRECALQHTR